MSILAQLKLSPEQEAAVCSARSAVAVTAGAGSGKTRTLVGRYLWHIEQGRPVRSLIAVTFTEKAAHEMRNRIRQFIGEWRRLALPAAGAATDRWDAAFTELDAARIGTIHSLCAAILRAHPAEAGVDPLFEVLEENTAALLQARAVEETLAWAIADPICAALFGPLREHALRQTLIRLLRQRLDAGAAFQVVGEDALAHWAQAAERWFTHQLGDGVWQGALADLAGIGSRTPTDKMELARQEVLGHWRQTATALPGRDWARMIAGLLAMRQANSSHGAKANWPGDDLTLARAAMKALREYHDGSLLPLLGKPAEPGADWRLDLQAAALQPGLQRLFHRCLASYEAMKEERHALDFDDLEAKTAALLDGHPPVRARWQAAAAALLVDEFQDTNHRQRQIIYHLAGFPTASAGGGSYATGCGLFIVGDAKQSIYRFRGADVTVFRGAQADITAAGGQETLLDVTYRGHQALVAGVNQLLAPIMGEVETPDRPYHTPFAPLRSHRPGPNLSLVPPWIEFHLGLGGSEEGREAAAAGLTTRLRELQDQGCAWRQMALLFRAATHFGVYEDALEEAGIPFVTVAGRGFYERPEIRDLLNALAAIADPSDDLAVAGWLRSPMCGLSDAALFWLRRGADPDAAKLGFWQALHDDPRLACLDAADAAQARRGREILATLQALAGRHSVAYVLKQLLDRTHYRAALRLAAGGERAWRNVDKLLADAHRSRLVAIPDFLEYVRSLRDVAARMGEAAAEAGDVVQLMTIHKAKGLEFPVVVLADASYNRRETGDFLILDETLGPLLRIHDEDVSRACPLTYRLGEARQRDQEEAEGKRLLYVAATRAQDKLLISGYTGVGNSGNLQPRGWLEWLGKVVGLDAIELPEMPTAPISPVLDRAADAAIGLTLYPLLDPDRSRGQEGTGDPRPAAIARSLPADLLAPLIAPELAEHTDEKEADPPRRVWRVARRGAAFTAAAPAWVVGVLAHKALQHWRFPDQADFAAFLRPVALEMGLVSAPEIDEAVRETAKLLARFQRHPLFAELERAERRHEVAFSVAQAGQIDSGAVDLIARRDAHAAWVLYDFKTDEVADAAALADHISKQKYDRQLERYVAALTALLDEAPQARLVFLDVGGGVLVR